jgi:hypothetical protein
MPPSTADCSEHSSYQPLADAADKLQDPVAEERIDQTTLDRQVKNIDERMPRLRLCGCLAQPGMIFRLVLVTTGRESP